MPRFIPHITIGAAFGLAALGLIDYAMAAPAPVPQTYTDVAYTDVALQLTPAQFAQIESALEDQPYRAVAPLLYQLEQQRLRQAEVRAILAPKPPPEPPKAAKKTH